MRNIKFHTVRATNILCFGPEGVEIHFDDYGNIVQIQGINLDLPGVGSGPASNGSGKSSVIELLSISLYGRTIKKPTKNKGAEILNVLANKGEVEVQWDDFRVVRTFTRNKNTGVVSSKVVVWESKDRIWDDETKIDKAGGNQEFIDQKIGLSHHAFCSIVVFDDSNIYSFLGADLPKKREIIENILDLDQYKQYHDNAKQLIKETKGQIKDLTTEYERLRSDVDACRRRIDSFNESDNKWRSEKRSHLQEIASEIKEKMSQLKNSAGGDKLAEWQNVQDRINVLNSEVADLEEKQIKLVDAISKAKTTHESAKNDKYSLQETTRDHLHRVKESKAELEKTLKLIESLENLKPGAKCPYCHGTIHRENYGDTLIHSRQSYDDQRAVIEQIQSEYTASATAYNKKVEAVQMIADKIHEAESRLSSLNAKIIGNRKEIQRLSAIPKPDGTTEEKLLEALIVRLKQQYEDEKKQLENGSPYSHLIEDMEKEMDEKNRLFDRKGQEIKAAESDLPYLEYWVEAFGDNGIRKYVIEGIIPALNSRVSHWLRILIDGIVQVTLDNKLDETITRSGNPASYSNMSKGEIQRINLAISQSAAYIRMLNSGSCPSVVFMDEVTGGGIDRAGIPALYNMILELAKERQVFVTTHNENLLALLNGCETITVKKQNDISVLA